MNTTEDVRKNAAEDETPGVKARPKEFVKKGAKVYPKV